MPVFGGFDPALATVVLLALNGVAPLPRAAVCIPAGAALGWAAFGPAMLGTAIGFAVGFMLARVVLYARVARFTSRRPWLAMVIRAVDQEGWRLLALLRLGSPVPGPVITAACAVTRMRAMTFLLTSLLAVVPQTLLFVYLGHAARTAVTSASPTDPSTVMTAVGVLCTIMALWRVGAAAKRQTRQMMANAG